MWVTISFSDGLLGEGLPQAFLQIINLINCPYRLSEGEPVYKG